MGESFKFYIKSDLRQLGIRQFYEGNDSKKETVLDLLPKHKANATLPKQVFQQRKLTEFFKSRV